MLYLDLWKEQPELNKFTLKEYFLEFGLLLHVTEKVIALIYSKDTIYKLQEQSSQV